MTITRSRSGITWIFWPPQPRRSTIFPQDLPVSLAEVEEKVADAVAGKRLGGNDQAAGLAAPSIGQWEDPLPRLDLEEAGGTLEGQPALVSTMDWLV